VVLEIGLQLHCASSDQVSGAQLLSGTEKLATHKSKVQYVTVYGMSLPSLWRCLQQWGLCTATDDYSDWPRACLIFLDLTFLQQLLTYDSLLNCVTQNEKSSCGLVIKTRQQQNYIGVFSSLKPQLSKPKRTSLIIL
jgi:hypothetical protein